MTEDRRQKTEDRKDTEPSPSSVLCPLSSIFPLALCLCILALRVTYTEAPTRPDDDLGGRVLPIRSTA